MNGRPYQVVGAKLRQELLREHYQVGDRLPPERVIAERLDVSRATVRDAMIMLELEGRIEVRKGSGIYVISTESEVPYPAQTTPGLSTDLGVFEMLQARQLIESHIAEFAASQVTKNDIQKLHAALEEEQQAIGAQQDNESADKAFHLAIAEATQNSALVDSVMHLWQQREASASWQLLHKRLTNIDYRQQWLGEHQAIFKALKRRDPEGAKQAMWQHLENVKQTLLDLSDVDDPAFDGYLFDSYAI